MSKANTDKDRYRTKDRDATWDYERTPRDRQTGKPVGLFKLEIPSQTEGGQPEVKEYVVNILASGEAREWCPRARAILESGDLIPKKVELRKARQSVEIEKERLQAVSGPAAEEDAALADVLEKEIALLEDFGSYEQGLRDEYMEKMIEHLFRYGELTDLQEEIMSGNPETDMLFSAYMRLFLFTDPTNVLGNVVLEMKAARE